MWLSINELYVVLESLLGTCDECAHSPVECQECKVRELYFKITGSLECEEECEEGDGLIKNNLPCRVGDTLFGIRNYIGEKVFLSESEAQTYLGGMKND